MAQHRIESCGEFDRRNREVPLSAVYYSSGHGFLLVFDTSFSLYKLRERNYLKSKNSSVSLSFRAKIGSFCGFIGDVLCPFPEIPILSFFPFPTEFPAKISCSQT